ncbi:hypothetical protein [Streptomyces sp. MMBL 11-1]|nr:hypothetical protein [Streptomyces sp. MMBL 11-1]
MVTYVLLAIAAALFVIAAFTDQGRINLMALGLASMAGAFLIQAGDTLS